MRVKHLLMASALLSFMASCNDDTMDTLNDNGIEQTEIAGAKLIAQGGTIQVVDGVDSRITFKGNFENGDELGIGWFANNSNGAITENEYNNGQWSTQWAAAEVASKLWGNHRFMYFEDGNKFCTNSNVYEGAHFSYFPHKYTAKLGVLKLELNNKQTQKDGEADVRNSAIMVGPRKLVSEKDVNNGQLEFQTSLRTVSNMMLLTVNPDEKMNVKEVLKNQPIVKVSVDVKQNTGNFFNHSFNVNPTALPVSEDDKDTKKYSDKLTWKNYDTSVTSANGLFNLGGQTANALSPVENEKTNTIFTDVEFADVTVAQAQTLFINYFPVNQGITFSNWSETEAPLTVTVSTKFGHFKFYEKEQSKKPAIVASLEKLFKGEEQTSGTTPKVKITNAGTGARYTFDLSDATEYVADYQIKTAADWAEAVKVANALYELDAKKYATATFEVAGNIEFTKGEMVENNKVKITVENATAGEKNQITIKGDVTLSDANVTFNNETNKKVTINVEKGTLTLDGKVTMQGTINNYSVINVAAGSALKGVDNVNKDEKNKDVIGRVNVVYGSYVELNGTATDQNKGIIAYELEDSKIEPYRINRLMETSTKNQKVASVNTIVIGNGMSLDALQKGELPTTDPYDKVNENLANLATGTLAKLNIELNGGTLTNVNFSETNKKDEATLPSGDNTGKEKVANVFVKGANSVVEDVDITGKLEVEAGASVTIDAVRFNHTQNKGQATETTNSYQYFAQIANIESKGTVTFKVNASISGNVNNEGVLDAATNEAIVRTKNKIAQTTSGVNKGNIEQGTLTEDAKNFQKTGKAEAIK